MFLACIRKIVYKKLFEKNVHHLFGKCSTCIKKMLCVYNKNIQCLLKNSSHLLKKENEKRKSISKK